MPEQELPPGAETGVLTFDEDGAVVEKVVAEQIVLRGQDITVRNCVITPQTAGSAGAAHPEEN